MQSIPLAVLKRGWMKRAGQRAFNCMQSIPLAVLKHKKPTVVWAFLHCMQSIPLAVLKRQNWSILIRYTRHCMQSIPLAVLKPYSSKTLFQIPSLHAIHTACGIETIAPATKTNTATNCMQSIPLAVLKQVLVGEFRINESIPCNPYRLRCCSTNGAVAHKSCATAFFMHKKSLHPSKRAEAGVK